MHHAPRGVPSHSLALLTAVLLTLLALFAGSPSPYPAAASTAPAGTVGLPGPAPADHRPDPADHRPGPADHRPGPADTGGDAGRGDSPGGAPRADAQCGTLLCSTQSGTRQEAHGERPPQHAQPVTAVQEPAVAAPPSRRVAPVGGYVPCPVGHVVQVGGRAPPGGSGI